jgi:hypothetical protein
MHLGDPDAFVKSPYIRERRKVFHSASLVESYSPHVLVYMNGRLVTVVCAGRQ